MAFPLLLRFDCREQASREYRDPPRGPQQATSGPQQAVVRRIRGQLAAASRPVKRCKVALDRIRLNEIEPTVAESIKRLPGPPWEMMER